MKVKIIGAGSIGNHLARAFVRSGWAVTVVDRDPEALRRMREEIYPQRYGRWEPAIALAESHSQPRGGFDVICVGTPPDTRMALALEALAERPRVLQLEKPLCAPNLEGLEPFLAAYRQQPATVALVGYNHAVAASVEELVRLLKESAVGPVETLDVEFREHWRGIFAAHPWLRGPQDSYLGSWRRGGGASGEHSHALHLWYVLSRAASLGRVMRLCAFFDMRRTDGLEYDAVAAVTLRTERGAVGRVVQDVVTFPSRKCAFVQGRAGYIEWICGGAPSGDVVRLGVDGRPAEERVFPKTREDDFLREVQHIEGVLDGRIPAEASPLSLDSGVAVMRFLASAHAHRDTAVALDG